MSSDNKTETSKNKTLINTLLWGGAVLAIIGLWLPNWVAPLIDDVKPFLNLPAFRTPLVSYSGYIVLWVACILVVGLRGSAGNYKAPGWVGLVSVIMVIASSILAQLGGPTNIILLLFTIGSFLATLFIYWTMAKVSEIRSMIKRAVWLLNLVALILGSIAAVAGQPLSTVKTLVYGIAGIYTVAWLVIAISVVPSHYRYMMEKRKRDDS